MTSSGAGTSSMTTPSPSMGYSTAATKSSTRRPMWLSGGSCTLAWRWGLGTLEIHEAAYAEGGEGASVRGEVHFNLADEWWSSFEVT
jgi:hypothetical protein